MVVLILGVIIKLIYIILQILTAEQRSAREMRATIKGMSISSFIFLINPIIELCHWNVKYLNFNWPWGSRKCNERHQSN